MKFVAFLIVAGIAVLVECAGAKRAGLPRDWTFAGLVAWGAASALLLAWAMEGSV